VRFRVEGGNTLRYSVGGGGVARYRVEGGESVRYRVGGGGAVRYRVGEGETVRYWVGGAVRYILGGGRASVVQTARRRDSRYGVAHGEAGSTEMKEERH
jgi:hypothetical protein